MANHPKKPEELENLQNAFDRATKYVDSHLREFRYGIYGVAAVGGVLTIRGLRIFTRFKRARDLPRSYVSKNVTLQGIVRRVDPESRALLVEHQPWIQLWKRNVPPDSLLPVSVGGVRLGVMGYQWMDITMRNKRVDFTLLGITANNEAECIVKSTEGVLNKRCLNSEAVRLGFGDVAPINKRLSNNKTYAKFYRQLLHMEAKALSDHNGMWSTVSTNKTSRNFLRKLWKMLEEVAKLPFRMRSVLRIDKAPA